MHTHRQGPTKPWALPALGPGQPQSAPVYFTSRLVPRTWQVTLDYNATLFLSIFGLDLPSMLCLTPSGATHTSSGHRACWIHDNGQTGRASTRGHATLEKLEQQGHKAAVSMALGASMPHSRHIALKADCQTRCTSRGGRSRAASAKSSLTKPPMSLIVWLGVEAILGLVIAIVVLGQSLLAILCLGCLHAAFSQRSHHHALRRGGDQAHRSVHALLHAVCICSCMVLTCGTAAIAKCTRAPRHRLCAWLRVALSPSGCCSSTTR